VGIVSLFAAYRLKLKEFRVAQIKSRIDALEQAGVFSGPESKENGTEESKQSGTQHDQVVRAMEAIKAGAWHRLTETEKLYTKYKWLLDAKNHGPVEHLLKECNIQSSELAMASIKDPEKFMKDFPRFVGKTQDLQRTYEDARHSTIERLYMILNKEVGI
jgi:hypothetical protein